MLSNQSGIEVAGYLYTPFGEMWAHEEGPGFIDENDDDIDDRVDRLFTGQMYDKESGLYYMNARYYDPDIGTFMTADPAMSGLNHYAYASCNPIKYTDPTGLDDENGGTWESGTDSGDDSDDSTTTTNDDFVADPYSYSDLGDARSAMAEAAALAAACDAQFGDGTWAASLSLGSPFAPASSFTNWDWHSACKDMARIEAARATAATPAVGVGQVGQFTVAQNFSKNVGGIKIGEKRITDDLKDGTYKASRYKENRVGKDYDDRKNQHFFIVTKQGDKITTISFYPEKNHWSSTKYMGVPGEVKINTVVDQNSLLIGNKYNGTILGVLPISATMANNFAQIIQGSSNPKSSEYNPFTPSYSGYGFNCQHFANQFEIRANHFYNDTLPITIPLF